MDAGLSPSQCDCQGHMFKSLRLLDGAPRSRDAQHQRTWQGKAVYYLSLRPIMIGFYSGKRRKQRDWLDSESASNG